MCQTNDRFFVRCEVNWSPRARRHTQPSRCLVAVGRVSPPYLLGAGSSVPSLISLTPLAWTAGAEELRTGPAQKEEGVNRRLPSYWSSVAWPPPPTASCNNVFLCTVASVPTASCICLANARETDYLISNVFRTRLWCQKTFFICGLTRKLSKHRVINLGCQREERGLESRDMTTGTGTVI